MVKWRNSGIIINEIVPYIAKLWRGTGGREPGKKGGKREKPGREAGSLRWREPGESEKNSAKFHYISE